MFAPLMSVCRGLSAGSEPCMGVNLCGFGPTRLQARKLRLGSARVAAVVDSANVPRRARDGASSITLRFEMDGRYRPQLYGGNVPERLADLQLLALHDWRVGL